MTITDLAPVILLVAAAGAALYRPWLGLLGLAVVGYLRPAGYADGLLEGVPAYALLFGVTVASTLGHVALGRLRLRPPPLDWRLGLLLALWLWFALTSSQAILPWAAWDRFLEFSKVMALVALTLALVDTREKLLWLVAAITLSFALVAVKGGYWALTTGFSDRVYGPPASHFYDNNHFAVAAVMTLPLLLFWRALVPGRAARWVLTGVAALAVAAVLSSWSRGALLALAAMALVLLWQGHHRGIAAALAGVMGVLVLSQFPDTWLERMATLAEFQEEGSARGRLETWRVGILYSLQHPWTGVGFDGWRFATQFAGGGGRDWHSAYVEVLAEHGVPGLLLWLTLVLGTMVSLARTVGDRVDRRLAAALLAALAGYVVGAGFLGITYWDILYQVLALGVVLHRLARGGPASAPARGTQAPADPPHAPAAHGP